MASGGAAGAGPAAAAAAGPSKCRPAPGQVQGRETNRLGAERRRRSSAPAMRQGLPRRDAGGQGASGSSSEAAPSPPSRRPRLVLALAVVRLFSDGFSRQALATLMR